MFKWDEYLRSYQARDVERIRAAFGGGFRNVLYQLATGGGKTSVLSYVADQALQKNKSVLVLAHRWELIDQISGAFNKFGIPHGIIAPKQPFVNTPVQVASVQTLVRRLGKLKLKPDLIVHDEVHHCVSVTHRKIIDHYPDASMLGVTATPHRLDGKGLGRSAGGYFDHMICGPSTHELILAGYLAKPVIYAPPLQANLKKIKKLGGDYVRDELAEVMDKPSITGDAVTHYRRVCPGARALVFCVSIDHAMHVTEQFRAAGINAAFVAGNMESNLRKSRFSDFESGRVPILVSVDLVSEGVDIPAIECLIDLRPTQSLAMYLQHAGRALRIAPGKTHAYILDHAGNVDRHGLPQEERDWSLDGFEKRKKRDTEDSAPALKTCRVCFAVNPASASKCEQCGAPFIVLERTGPEYVEGELLRLDTDAIMLKKAEQKREVGRARGIDELIEIGKKRGYHYPEIWAKHVFNGRQRKTQKRLDLSVSKN